MTKCTTDNNDIKTDDSESSSYLLSSRTSEAMDFGGLFSDRFLNLTPLHSTASTPTELYTATRYGKRFVLKGLKESYRTDPIQNIALTKEFEIGISLEHPNIRRTIGLETVDGLGNIIILEYVDGVTLDHLVSSHTLPRASARMIAASIADALAYMHSKRVLHRDLKPSNILVSLQGGTVKLIDFNLSDSDSFVVLKNPAGTKNYIAPEQLQADAKPSALADIYSFGVVLDELADASGDILLRDAARRCMNADPTRRPQSVAEIKLPSVNPSASESLSAILYSGILTYILAGICAILAADIIYTLLTSYR